MGVGQGDTTKPDTPDLQHESGLPFSLCQSDCCQPHLEYSELTSELAVGAAGCKKEPGTSALVSWGTGPGLHSCKALARAVPSALCSSLGPSCFLPILQLLASNDTSSKKPSLMP